MLDCTETGISPGGLTVLKTDADHTASKIYSTLRNGIYCKVRDYDLGFMFRAEPYTTDHLAELADLVCLIRSSGNAVILRGGLDAAYHAAIARDPGYRIARRKNDRHDGIPAHITEVPRQWIMIDIDGYPMPPDASLRDEPTKIIDACIHDILPAEFHDAECFWQLSSSAGLVPGVLKAHLSFWLAEPHDNAFLRRWFTLNAPHVDRAPYSANQPHFIADPVIMDGDDPLAERTGWRHGVIAQVHLPPIPEPQQKGWHDRARSTGDAATPGLYARSIGEALQQLGDGEGHGGFHAPLLAASMQYALRCAKGGLRDDDAFIATLIKAIEAAPKHDTRTDVDAYLDLAYLHRISNGAFDLVANTNCQDVDPAEIGMPVGFGMTSTGLHFIDPDKEDAKPVWVCQPFSIVGDCEDGIGGGWGIVLTWHDQADHHHAWIVPRELSHGEPHTIASCLEAKGLRCNYVASAQASLRRFLASVRSDKRLKAVERGGWHGNSYLMADGTLYGRDLVIMRPELQRRDLSCASQGTLEDWQREVAQYAVGNSRIAFFIAAAFAGPLLEIASEPSGGFHLHGMSQSGKSTAAFAAASVNGKGARDGAYHQWRTTANGLEGIASRCSDGCLVLDETSQADARDAGEAIYQLANERGKTRADRYGAARPTANWRIVFLSTGEITLAQRLTEANKRTTTGMEIRLVNIAADGGCGTGIFENLHELAGGAGALADLIRTNARQAYGTAGRAFVERLTEMRTANADGLYEIVDAMRAKFIAEYLPSGAEGQVRSVCGRFGVVAAAGEMAIAWDILPWPVGEATRAAARCFADWIGVRGTIGSGEKHAAVRQVRAFLELHGTSRFAEIRASHTEEGHHG